MLISCHQISACSSDEEVQKTIQLKHSLASRYEGICGRHVSKVPYVDLYVAGLLRQRFSKQASSEVLTWEEVNLFDILHHATDKVPEVFVLRDVQGPEKMNAGKEP